MDETSIPFVKPARVGNYKVWRSKIHMTAPSSDKGKKKDSDGIECINISNIDCTWKVQIPSTSRMFATITNAFNVPQNRDKFLGMLFTNMQNVCLINNEMLHDAFAFLVEMMNYPYLLLPEKEMTKRLRRRMEFSGIDKKRIKGEINEWVENRRKLYELAEKKKALYLDWYESQLDIRKEPTDEELEHDELAEKSLDIINGVQNGGEDEDGGHDNEV